MVATLLSSPSATTAESVLPEGTLLDTSNVLSVFLSLAAVLALIVLVGWVMKRIHRVQRGGSALLEIVDVLPVGPKEKILLVRAGESRILVGMTPGNLNTLGALDAKTVTTQKDFKVALSEHAA
ncbi:MAG: flagellar biosynthetic protein FliO [Gammaproteobacteria bacterium]|nr:flagellar biosynthetic protein FliO [Gammaproteobacteria bacterium]